MVILTAQIFLSLELDLIKPKKIKNQAIENNAEMLRATSKVYRILRILFSGHHVCSKMLGALHQPKKIGTVKSKVLSLKLVPENLYTTSKLFSFFQCFRSTYFSDTQQFLHKTRLLSFLSGHDNNVGQPVPGPGLCHLYWMVTSSFDKGHLYRYTLHMARASSRDAIKVSKLWAFMNFNSRNLDVLLIS